MHKPKFKKDHVVTSVVAVIVNNSGEVLLTKRNIPPFLGEWVMPGGKIDLGEQIVSAIQREVMEEVGLTVEVQNLLDVFEHVTPGEHHYHFVILYYRCHPLSNDIIQNEAEVSEARWVPSEKLSNYKMPEGTRYILEKLFPEPIYCEL
ncbi:MAG: NUDIX domain-containing protein [Desulfuromonadaceae bacterium]|nr:NUDIX domain-containing protein [Desulfuromonadaceae bacterium]